MASNTVRWSVTKHLVTLIRSELAGVQVEPGWPGDAMQAECIWIDELSGDVNIPVMSSGRKYRDDQFTVPFQIRVAGQLTLDATMSRLSTLVAGVEDVLADDPGIGAEAGVIAAQVTSERMTAGEIRNVGWIGFGEVVVTVHARLE